MNEAPETPAVRDGKLTRPDGRTLAWVEAGVPDGRPILRVPGTPGSRLQVRPDQSPWLDRGLRMILTERPGFGASTRHPGRSFLDHADDLAAILAELGLGRVPIMGGSGAGPYILAFAARPFSSSSSAWRTSLNSLSSALSTLGKCRSSFSSAATMVEPITTRANHLWSAGTMCQGASRADVCRIIS